MLTKLLLWALAFTAITGTAYAVGTCLNLAS